MRPIKIKELAALLAMSESEAFKHVEANRKEEPVSKERQNALDKYDAFVSTQASIYVAEYGGTIEEACELIKRKFGAWLESRTDAVKLEIAIAVSKEMDRIQSEYEQDQS